MTTTRMVKSVGEKHVCVVGNVEHDELDEAACVEQSAERPGVAPALAGEASRSDCAADLAHDGDDKVKRDTS